MTMAATEFDAPERIHLLWGVVAIALLVIYGHWQRRRFLRRFADAPLLSRLAPAGGWARPAARLVLLGATLALLVIALMGPRWGQREQTVIRRGIEVMVVLDVSRSMLARDLAPNRLERAKVWIKDDLLPALGGDRVGLIVFAGAARLKSALTSDYGFFRLALDEVSTASAPVGGTLIGDALRLAGESFRGPVETHRVVLLFTDGEDQESFPVEAAQKLWDEQKVTIFAFGLGDSRDGARIPLAGGGDQGYLKYKDEVVWSRANFSELERIARASGRGVFVPVGTREVELGKLYRESIVPMARADEHREQQTIPLPSQYHHFALAALACLVVESLIRDGPRPWRWARTATVREAA